jgi:molybdenum cofactor cytidylyltransferase
VVLCRLRTRLAKDVSGTRAQTAGLILAAGGGTRFGGGKMLAELHGRPMLQYALDLAAAVELDPVVVVLGKDAVDVEGAVLWGAERRVVNPDPARGLSSSVLLGMAELGNADRVLVLLGDQPFLSIENLRVIIGTARDASRPIVVPRYAGVPGNPVLLEREAWALVRALEGDRGMSQLFEKHPDLLRFLDLPDANPDIDTRDDLDRAVSA